jgi:DNA-binding transcriptional regulator YiaG
MTFSEILIAIERSYGFDVSFIAEKMKTTAEEVQGWEEGKTFPSDPQLKDFSALFAVPLATLQSSVPGRK